MLSSTACQVRPDLSKILRELVRDHGKTFCERARFQVGDDYHRELVHTAHDIEVWVLTWLPGQITPIHDHGGVVTVTTVLAGSVREERFERVDRMSGGLEVRPTWSCVRETGAIDVIDPVSIHRVRPIGTAVTLHLYAPTCVEGTVYTTALS